MVNRWLVLAAVILFTAIAIKHAPAVWRGPPQMLAALDDETRDWVIDLKNKVGGPCCDTADGFPVEVDGWDMAGTVDDTSGAPQACRHSGRRCRRLQPADGFGVPGYRRPGVEDHFPGLGGGGHRQPPLGEGVEPDLGLKVTLIVPGRLLPLECARRVNRSGERGSGYPGRACEEKRRTAR